MQRYSLVSKSHRTFNHSISAAKRFISLFHHIGYPTEEQLAMLAAAHYTLGLQDTISSQRAKMHLNSAITLLHSVNEHARKINWYSLMANAYIKRAELLEQNDGFEAAMIDYQKGLEIYEAHIPSHKIPDFDRLLLAQCAISIADLAVNEEVEYYSPHCTQHPLFYINKALEYLSKLPKEQDEIWTTLAYAHQIAGIALTSMDLFDAAEAFRTAIAMAFKAEPKAACQILGDIYNSMGLLYEQHFQQCPIQKAASCLNEQAMIYFGIALLFSANDTLAEDEDSYLLDAVFEIIYRALDPFLTPLSPTVMRDFIDALIFIYYCIVDNTLPNQDQFYPLNQPEFLKVYAQHIYWLVMECQRRENPDARLLDWANPSAIDNHLDLTNILSALSKQNTPDNVHYLFKESSLEQIN